MHPFFDRFEEVTNDELVNPLSADFFAFVDSYGERAAQVVGVRKFKDIELIILEVKTGRPKHCPYSLNKTETVAVAFWAIDTPPTIWVDREDFPDTPHQNLMPEGLPYSICIDDRLWREAKLTYTPAELLQRIVMWFEKTGVDELHGINQPLDPYYSGDSLTMTLPRDVFNQRDGDQYDLVAGIMQKGDGNDLMTIPIETGWPAEEFPGATCVFITIEVDPTQMVRIRHTPNTLASLHAELESRGINLLDRIATIIDDWSEENEWRYRRLNSLLGVLLKMPIIHPRTGEAASSSLVGFITEQSVGEIGVALQRLEKNTLATQEDFPYFPALNCPPLDPKTVEGVVISSANVNAAFDATLATQMAGHSELDDSKVVLIGAGAIGSLVADSLAREGRFEWTIVDIDRLLPHNLARHSLRLTDVHSPKAEALAYHLTRTRLGIAADSIIADTLNLSGAREELFLAAIRDADLILDASASVATSRDLCDRPSTARRITFFFSPAGNAAILMAEDADRTVNLRTLEAEFYSQILSDPDVSDVLTVPPERIPYSGDCRSLTTQMPASRAQILSGLVTEGINEAIASPGATLKVWQADSNGAIKAKTFETAPPREYPLKEWTVHVLESVADEIQTMRRAKLPCETGGALMGVVDVPQKRIDVLKALPAPPDSQERLTEFLRGVEGLTAGVMDAMKRTLDQIRYVGEWHSHPKGCSSAPSRIDLTQLAQLTATLSIDGCPGVQMIAGEKELGVNLGVVE